LAAGDGRGCYAWDVSLNSAASTAKISAALGSVGQGSVVSEVAERLLAYFTSGDIAVGTRLPAERQLAASLGVGRSAVREALAALEILGIVIVRPGSGTYLRDGISELLPRTLSWGMMLGAPRTRELVELRSGLEVQAAQLAADRITDEALGRLRGSLPSGHARLWPSMLRALIASIMMAVPAVLTASDTARWAPLRRGSRTELGRYARTVPHADLAVRSSRVLARNVRRYVRGVNPAQGYKSMTSRPSSFAGRAAEPLPASSGWPAR